MIPLAMALKLAPYAVIAGALAWGAWERDGRQRAEKRLVEQQNQQLRDANEAWAKVNTLRGEFDEQVAAGLAKLNETQRRLDGTIEDYRRAVASDPGGRVLLTDRERQRLRMLVGQPPAGLEAGGNPVRASDAPAPVRR